MKTLDPKFKKSLKQSAHHLEPVVIIGQKGITPSLIKEIDTSLTAHELLKIKINHGEHTRRGMIAQEICYSLNAHLIQNIGKVCVIWRKNDGKNKNK